MAKHKVIERTVFEVSSGNENERILVEIGSDTSIRLLEGLRRSDCSHHRKRKCIDCQYNPAVESLELFIMSVLSSAKRFGMLDLVPGVLKKVLADSLATTLLAISEDTK